VTPVSVPAVFLVWCEVVVKSPDGAQDKYTIEVEMVPYFSARKR
jgi:hypothetical protein